VGSPTRGEITLLNLDAAKGGKQILDVDQSIPGMTALFVDDLVSGIGAHPQGDFIFTLNSSTGSLSLIFRDDQLRESFRVELDSGPLLDLAIWPPITRALEPGSLSIPPRAFITAPLKGQILELDLEALGAGDADALQRIWSLPSSGAACGSCEPGEGCIEGLCQPRPGRIALSPEGDLLIVAHAEASRLTLFDLSAGAAPQTIDLDERHPCDDGYLTRLQKPEPEDPPCSKLSQCEDELDNDEDGLIDAEDEGCQSQFSGCADELCLSRYLDWEGPLPACIDGEDNDGDGLIDRADPGCADEGDEEELDGMEGRELGEALCADRQDNDGDGLVDWEDPGCTDPEGASSRYDFERDPACSNGLDDDGDGLIDFGQDPECYAASDDNEAGAGVSVGPSALESFKGYAGAEERDFLYIIDPNARLLRLDLGSLALARVSVSRPVLSMAARQRRESQSVLLITDDSELRSIEISAQSPLLTEDGHEIYARTASNLYESCEPHTPGVQGDLLDPEGDLDGDGVKNLLDLCPRHPDPDQLDSDGDLEGDLCEVNICVTAFYIVEDGIAWEVSGLEDQLGGYAQEWPMILDVEGPIPFSKLTAQPLEILGADQDRDRGRMDPLVQSSTRSFFHEELNLFRSALARSNAVLNPPQLLYKNSAPAKDLSRHPLFCRAQEPGAEADTECIPVGFDEEGLLESAELLYQRTPNRLSGLQGVEVLEEDPKQIIADSFSLSYEGLLPDSESRTGQFGQRQDADHWSLLDYEVDFCKLGVEPGDVLLVKVFVPLSAQEADRPECRLLTEAAQNSEASTLREPLRYRITELSAHRLDLEREPRLNYSPQLPRDERSILPKLASAPDAPLQVCAAQFIYYRIRVANDTWLLTGDYSKHRHPWINKKGQCVIAPERVERQSRVRLGETFESDWFRFRIDAFHHERCQASGCAFDRGIPEGKLPHMIDARFEFSLTVGLDRERLSDVAILPQQMEWLPNDDRLYIVDSALETLTEIGGLDTSNSERMRLIRRYH